MKFLTSFIGICLLLAFNSSAYSQVPLPDYFVGKWKVEIKDTPQGDAKMTITLERKDGKLIGYQMAKEMPDTIKFEKIEEKEKSLVISYTAQGYDITMTMEKKDDDHVTGSLMQMFDLNGERIKDLLEK